MKKIFCILSLLAITVLSFVDIPQASISNGIIKADLYPPDAGTGYYRGSRFDWSGNMPSLEYNGHTYFEKWFTKYSPEIHDVIMGPVEDFTPLDFPETKAGDNFVKIGVGLLNKPDDRVYELSRNYPIINGGKWSWKAQADNVRFFHKLNDGGYSYEYEKSIVLVKGKPEMVIEHIMRNTGKRTIETSVYCHNFFVIDKQLVGPDCIISFPFDLKGEGKGFGEAVKFDGKRIIFQRPLAGNEQVYCGDVRGYGSNKSDYDIRIENKSSGGGVRITCDQPIVRLVFWSCSTTACPEPYINIKVEPGKEFRWKINYEFYTSPK